MNPSSFADTLRLAASTLAIMSVASTLTFAQPGSNDFNNEAKEPVKEEPTIWLSEGVPDLQGIWSNKWIVDMADGRFAEKTVKDRRGSVYRLGP